MPGRKPLPTHLKAIKGTTRASRRNRDEPMPAADNIEMPEGMSADARMQWSQVLTQLKDAGVLTNVDVPALRLYCEAFARWKLAHERIAKEGPVVKSRNGFAVQSPYLHVANKSFDQMLKILTEFGMTPSSRSRVKTSSWQRTDGGNPADRYFD